MSDVRLATPITADAYADYGHVVAASSAVPRVANHGTAAAWDDLAPLVNGRPASARPTVSVFRCAPLDGTALDVRVLERHPRSTQLFVPMNASRYLVVVALGAVAPQTETLRAFVVEGATAITYAPGIWHHPMVALDARIDFVNVLFADGTALDCEERSFEPALARVSVPSPR
ncbi:MAG: ureidoglycolate lyase [Sandaracinaceae bacterium]